MISEIKPDSYRNPELFLNKEVCDLLENSEISANTVKLGLKLFVKANL